MGQDLKEQDRPVYLTVTTLNGADDFEFDAWKEVENADFENNALLSKFLANEDKRKQFLSSMYSAVKSQKSSFYKNVLTLSK